MRTTYRELPEPQPSACKIPARTVTAIRIATQLWQNGEAYHSGAIEYWGWRARNEDLWEQAEAEGVVDGVKSQLRKAR